MNCWEKSPQEIEKMLGTSIKNGLSTQTAQKGYKSREKIHYIMKEIKKGFFIVFWNSSMILW